MPSPLLNDVDDALLHAIDEELLDMLPERQQEEIRDEFVELLDSRDVYEAVFNLIDGNTESIADEMERRWEMFLRRVNLANNPKYIETLRMAFAARYGEE